MGGSGLQTGQYGSPKSRGQICPQLSQQTQFDSRSPQSGHILTGFCICIYYLKAYKRKPRSPLWCQGAPGGGVLLYFVKSLLFGSAYFAGVRGLALGGVAADLADVVIRVRLRGVQVIQQGLVEGRVNFLDLVCVFK